MIRLVHKPVRKVRIFFNQFLLSHPSLVAYTTRRITVIDAFGTPGDTILTATVCRNLKAILPGLQINCITPNPELLIHDPSISELNGPRSLPTLKFWYLDLIAEKCHNRHLLSGTMNQLGIKQYDKQARFYLDAEEISAARRFCCDHVGRPFITINVQSREQVKTWPTAAWQLLLNYISRDFPDLAIVQLGTESEPDFGESVIRLAGKLPIRNSVAVQSLAALHIGCVSFLMHSANGVGVPSVIIYGGRETPDNSGYDMNENLYSNLPCSPCWLHDSCGDQCPHDLHCMQVITAEQVLASVRKILAQTHPRLQ
jgi:ADP-heptose:LPS heptosyltransferase